MWLELVLILLFILLNGFFSGAEIAVITSRKAKIQSLCNKGNKNAKLLLELKDNPDRFLATVQIGITVVGALASAIGGVAAVKILEPIIKTIPIKIIAMSGEIIAIGIVVMIISYLSLIFGELLPKSIALMNPEKIALLATKPILFFSRISSFFVYILTLSTNLFLKPFGKTFSEGSFVSEDEIKILMKEGREKGIFEPDEQELIRSVFEFTDISVKEVMVPIVDAQTIEIETPVDEVISLVSKERYSRYPVYAVDHNNIKGILYAKDVFKMLAQNIEISINKLLKPPFFVPETLMISRLLKEMQRKRMHMALVVSEHGAVTGIVSFEDLIEEIFGEIRDEFDIEAPVINIEEGIFIVDASISLRDLKDDYDIEIPESTQYDTLGGFIITKLQKIPSAGDSILLNNKELTIIEMENNRVSKVKVVYTEKKPLMNQKKIDQMDDIVL